MSVRFSAAQQVDRKLGLHTRVGLVLTTLAAVLLLLLGGLWLQSTRNAIHEEVEAATRVSRQWLEAVLGEMHGLAPAERSERLLAIVRGIGRVRANVLEVERIADGERLHVSPPSPYKAGRTAPAWFAGLLNADLPSQTLVVDQLRLTLRPDPSRAVLDAWDELAALAGWGLLLLVALFAGVRGALGRALRPLDQLMTALDRTGHGRFDTRLPLFPDPELGRLSRAFNGMADRLKAAVDENVRLETERELAERMQSRLEAERREIARELHDELSQGITAVRALAGAIVQRSPETPAVHAPAQSIVAVTGAMQDGVRGILHKLRPAEAGGLGERLRLCVEHWRVSHGGIALVAQIEVAGPALPDAVAQAALRIVQEGLTNVVRHAGATRVELAVGREAGGLVLTLADDGRGHGDGPSPQPGSGLGLTGMRERVALLGGRLEFSRPPAGGFALRAWLPAVQEELS